MQDLTGKITGSTLTAAEWNQLPQEVQNVITALGITLGSGDLNQLGKAIAGYIANGTFYTDSGVVDAYVLAVVGSKQPATAYTDGFEVSFVTANPNTGASTVNVAGLGVKNIKLTGGADPAAGDITGRVKCVFDSGNDWFELQKEVSTALEINYDNSTSGLTATDVQAAIDEGFGTDQNRVASAWVNFNGTGVVTIRDSYNVSSITDNGVGDYTINFASALADTNYAVIVTGSNTTDNFVMPVGGLQNGSTDKLTTSCDIALTLTPNLGTDAYDAPEISVLIIGGL